MKIKRDIWTASRLKTWQVCPMKEALRYRENMAPRSTKNALAFGTAIHKGLETRDVEQALSLLSQRFPKDQNEADELAVAEVTVIALLNAYFKRFEPFEEHEPEKLFNMPMITEKGNKSRNYAIAGKIDDLVKLDDRYWIVEYKTASQLTGSYFDRLYLDSQITMYMYAMMREGYDIAGVIYRVIRKPSLRRGKDEALEHFLERLEKDIEARPDFYFEERKLYRTAGDIKAFELMLLKEAKLADSLHKAGCSFQHSTACSMYGACEYLPFCTGEAGANDLYEYREANEELKEE